MGLHLIRLQQLALPYLVPNFLVYLHQFFSSDVHLQPLQVFLVFLVGWHKKQPSAELFEALVGEEYHMMGISECLSDYATNVRHRRLVFERVLMFGYYSWSNQKDIPILKVDYALDGVGFLLLPRRQENANKLLFLPLVLEEEAVEGSGHLSGPVLKVAQSEVLKLDYFLDVCESQCEVCDLANFDITALLDVLQSWWYGLSQIHPIG